MASWLRAVRETRPSQRISPVLDAKPILDRHLTDEQYHAIAEAVPTAYAACHELCTTNEALKFHTGIQQRSFLLNAFVEHALATFVAPQHGFHYQFGINSARNYWHLRLCKPRLTLTSHFVGRHSARTKARMAAYRAVLASQNRDLFDDQTSAQESHIYCNLLHGGFSRLESICLAIPTSDQSNVSHVMALPLLRPEPTQKEQIQEHMIFNLLNPGLDNDGTQNGKG